MFRKPVLASLLAILMLNGAPVVARAQAPDAGSQERLEVLFAELAESDRTDWQQIEAEITRIWSQSGSESTDFLLRRGREALEQGNFSSAIEHFSAITEQAPDFAEGWNARATAYYLQGNFELSLSDIEYVLALNPKHFGALSGLATILEQMGELGLALEALRAVHDLNPNRPNITLGIERLEREMGSSNL